MIEVEIKSKIKNKEEIEKRLNDMGAVFVKKVKQVDKIFGHPSFLDKKNMIIDGGIVPRIRTVNNKSVLEFKEIGREGGGFEIESNLSSIEMGLSLLEKLGFTESFTIDKTRNYYTYNDFEICVDDVDGIGSYIEIEKMVMNPEEKDQARGECLKIMAEISPDLTVENRKYGDLIQEKINQQNFEKNIF
jgi:adenylate cyclase class 2